MPLMVGERILGCVSVFHYNENNPFTKNDENMLSIFAQHASIAMDNAMLFNKIQEMAHVDELTGLLNRRALNEIGDYEIRRSIRLQRPIAVVMVDLDNFKSINDTYNHIVGDKALKEVGRVFRKNIRNIDILGRYGGDECIIIMPETNLENAVQTIKRVQKKLQEFKFKIGSKKLQITASYGISVYTENPPSLETMIKEADAAMYMAKDAGRNCIRVFKDR